MFSAPINTPNVNIYLSTNGGISFPDAIAMNVPNSGSYTLTVPNNQTTIARVWVEGVGNIFFDINNKNFAITAPNPISDITSIANAISIYPNPTDEKLFVNLGNSLSGKITITVNDAIGKSVYKNTLEEKSMTQVIPLKNISSGFYTVVIESALGKVVKKFVKE